MLSKLSRTKLFLQQRDLCEMMHPNLPFTWWQLLTSQSEETQCGRPTVPLGETYWDQR